MSIFKVNFTPDDVVAYLNAKYDDTFTLVKEIGVSPSLKARRVLVHSEKYPEVDILAVRYDKKEGDINCDNYMHIKYRSDVLECVNKILAELFDAAKTCVYYYPNNYTICETGSDEITFEQFITNPPAIVSVDASVITDVSKLNSVDIENKLNEIIKQNNYKISLKIRVFGSSTSDTELNDSDYMSFIVKNSPELVFNTDKLER